MTLKKLLISWYGHLIPCILGIDDALFYAILISAAGTKMSMDKTDETERKRQSLISANQAEQDAINAKKAATVEDYAQGQMTTPMRLKRYEDAATKTEGDLAQSLRDAGGGDFGTVSKSAEGKLSDDYMRKSASATASASDDIMKRARDSARSSALGNMFNQEANSGAVMEGDIAGLNSKAARYGRYGNTAINGVYNSGSLAGGILTGISPSVAGMGSK